MIKLAFGVPLLVPPVFIAPLTKFRALELSSRSTPLLLNHAQENLCSGRLSPRSPVKREVWEYV